MKCLAPGCTMDATEDSALCPEHKTQLQKAEAEILKDATRVVKQEMRQFERLTLVEPPIPSTEIAHRMVWPMKKVRRELRRFKDDRA